MSVRGGVTHEGSWNWRLFVCSCVHEGGLHIYMRRTYPTVTFDKSPYNLSAGLPHLSVYLPSNPDKTPQKGYL